MIFPVVNTTAGSAGFSIVRLAEVKGIHFQTRYTM
jgi:hypothetical protein